MVVMLCSMNENTLFASNVCLLGPKKVETDSADRSVWHESVKSCLLSSRPNTNVVTFDHFSEERFRISLYCANYFFVQSHGSPTCVACYDEDGTCTGYFSRDKVLNYPTGYFSNVKLCVLAACETAKGNENIAQAVYSKGAKCVIGYEESVLTVCNSTWIEYLNDALAIGWTVEDAMAYADLIVNDKYSRSGDTDSHKAYGNVDVVFK